VRVTRAPRSLALRVSAVVALVAATVAGAAMPAASASFTVSVTPDTGLVDGQSVHVVISGFGSGTPAIAECTAAGAAAAVIGDCTAISAGGTTADIVLQQQFLTLDSGLVDCGAAAGTCVIAAADISNLTPAGIATAPLTFAAPAPPTMLASATSDLIDGQTVTVGARGFAPNTAASVEQCGPTTAPANCDTSRAVTTTTDANGAFAVSYVMHRFLTTPAGAVDCGSTTCALTAPPAVTASISLQFPISNTVVTVTPSTGLVDGQAVSVNVSPAREAIAECRTPVTSTGDCSTVVFPTQYPAALTVHRALQFNGTTVDCGAHAGACVIAAADPGNIAGSLGIAPLSFAPVNQPGFDQHNWISDQAGVALLRDRHLVNAWGLAFGPTTPLWVSDNGTNASTLYRGGGGSTPPSIIPLAVRIADGAPTGVVFNPTHDFFVHDGAQSGAALFIFASENGDIDAWSPTVGTAAPPSTKAFHVASVRNAVFKGIALAHTSIGNFLYVTDFHHGTVDVFNHAFKPVVMPGAFNDPQIPAGYAPFNIQNLNGHLYVTYAKQDPAKHDDVSGAGHGFVDVYDTGGHLVQRLAAGGKLNSPWGLALAPRTFGPFGGALLVGNFGDGRINAFNPATGAFLGQLRRTNGKIMEIEGLWGLAFGNGVAGSPNTLLFSAGPHDEAHGLLGAITAGGSSTP
jgi:uncharacterized protein (TIGR03118 family)